MFIIRSSYDVGILAHFERGGLEKQRGGPPCSSYSRGNTVDDVDDDDSDNDDDDDVDDGICLAEIL